MLIARVTQYYSCKLHVYLQRNKIFVRYGVYKSRKKLPTKMVERCYIKTFKYILKIFCSLEFSM